MSNVATPVKKEISKKRSFIIHKVGAGTDKGNTTLTLMMREGLVKQYLYLLCDTDLVEDLAEGEDITHLIPQNFVVRTSELVRDEQTIVLKWIELV